MILFSSKEKRNYYKSQGALLIRICDKFIRILNSVIPLIVF